MNFVCRLVVVLELIFCEVDVFWDDLDEIVEVFVVLFDELEFVWVGIIDVVGSMVILEMGWVLIFLELIMIIY